MAWNALDDPADEPPEDPEDPPDDEEEAEPVSLVMLVANPTAGAPFCEYEYTE